MSGIKILLLFRYKNGNVVASELLSEVESLDEFNEVYGCEFCRDTIVTINSQEYKVSNINFQCGDFSEGLVHNFVINVTVEDLVKP